MNREAVTAIILAAGWSSRMGDFKPLLPVMGVPMLDRAIELFHGEGINDVRVVIGHRADELGLRLTQQKVAAVLNPRYGEGMFSSVVAGVQTLGADREAFFVLPVDIPLVRRQTIRDLLQVYEQRHVIVYPVYEGQRGHPPLIPASYGAGITGWKGDGGLRSLLEQYALQSVDVDVADEFILRDLDTPAAYQRLKQRFQTYETPSIGECMALLTRKYAVGKRGLDHACGVARIALHLGRALNDQGASLDLSLIAAGALLHDLAKGVVKHAAAGARILRDLGFPRVAEIVGLHMDLAFPENGRVGEVEVVYLADKLVRAGGRSTSLESRFQEKLVRFGTSSEAREAIMFRQVQAQAIRQYIEHRIGLLEAVLVKDRSQSLEELSSEAENQMQLGSENAPEGWKTVSGL